MHCLARPLTGPDPVSAGRHHEASRRQKEGGSEVGLMTGSLLRYHFILHCTEGWSPNSGARRGDAWHAMFHQVLHCRRVGPRIELSAGLSDSQICADEGTCLQPRFDALEYRRGPSSFLVGTSALHELLKSPLDPRLDVIVPDPVHAPVDAVDDGVDVIAFGSVELVQESRLVRRLLGSRGSWLAGRDEDVDGPADRRGSADTVTWRQRLGRSQKRRQESAILQLNLSALATMVGRVRRPRSLDRLPRPARVESSEQPAGQTGDNAPDEDTFRGATEKDSSASSWAPRVRHSQRRQQ